MTSDEAPLRRGGGMKYASLALPRRRLLLPSRVAAEAQEPSNLLNHNKKGKKMKKVFAVIAVLTSVFFTLTFAETPLDINTMLMRSTFKLEGNGSIGTAFILGKPMPKEPNRAYFVMVTAAHVLNQMKGEKAVLHLRKKEGESFKRIPIEIRIRKGDKALWTTHPSADVAVMYVSLPKEADITLMPTDLLATDEVLQKFEIHPGDRLTCLGFPLNSEANEAGFPILRSGYIASYPLVPTKTVKSFLFDFNVFEGNSGGPVYLVDLNRGYGGAINIGSVQFLVGLVSAQMENLEPIQSRTELRIQKTQLGLGVVIHAALIREALALLPAVPK